MARIKTRYSSLLKTIKKYIIFLKKFIIEVQNFLNKNDIFILFNQDTQKI